jgi:hypothetical protein
MAHDMTTEDAILLARHIKRLVKPEMQNELMAALVKLLEAYEAAKNGT